MLVVACKTTQENETGNCKFQSTLDYLTGSCPPSDQVSKYSTERKMKVVPDYSASSSVEFMDPLGPIAKGELAWQVSPLAKFVFPTFLSAPSFQSTSLLVSLPFWVAFLD